MAADKPFEYAIRLQPPSSAIESNPRASPILWNHTMRIGFATVEAYSEIGALNKLRPISSPSAYSWEPEGREGWV